MKILFCFGTRPEAIKMAPIIKTFKQNESFQTLVCVTAQHREMLDTVLDFFDIEPDFDLDLMEPNQSLNKLSSRIFASIDAVLIKEIPDYVFVHGDTTTSAIVAMAAFHNKIKIAHVEAGLRTYNKNSPFPEEINRQITSRVADLHFAPTIWSKNNLLAEKIDLNAIIVTGNSVIDALHIGLKKIEQGYNCQDLRRIKNLIIAGRKIIVITGHRRENFGNGFENLCQAIKKISENNDVQIIYPVHLNPNVQVPVNRILSNLSNVHLIPPLDYPAFLYLMSQSYLIITDSGGIQEEAPSLGKPVLVIRNTTERPEAVTAGTVKMTGTNKDSIINETLELINNSVHYNNMSASHNPYGDGKASNRILLHFTTNI